MQAFYERRRRRVKDRERRRERERERVRDKEGEEGVRTRERVGGNSVHWWRWFRVAKGGQRVEVTEGERKRG